MTLQKEAAIWAAMDRSTQFSQASHFDDPRIAGTSDPITRFLDITHELFKEGYWSVKAPAETGDRLFG
jgi:hypothetical protein